MRLLEDTRIPGRNDFVITEASRLMRVPDEVRKCVGFVGYDAGTGPQLVGTFFLVAINIAPGHYSSYAVTAAHVIEGIRAKSVDGLTYLRVNTKDGAKWATVSIDEWTFHSEHPETVDVAALPIGLPSAVFDQLSFPMEAAITESVIAENGIGVGEEVFLTGLFVNHYGSERNLPIVRTGNIAAMPAEPIKSKRGPMDAYLIEARSIGGLSGSPVFVNLGLVRWVGGGAKFATKESVYYLLGLMHGHWDVRPLPSNDVVMQDGLADEAVNMGIGIVVPVTRIREVLDHPNFVAKREQRLAEIELASEPAMDGVADAAGTAHGGQPA